VTTKERITAMTAIHADELQPGDVLVWDGRNRTITDVDRRDGWAWPIAVDGTGWAIALDHQLIHVQRDRLSVIAIERTPAPRASDRAGRRAPGASVAEEVDEQHVTVA
jgi:hypothetical protein